MTEKQHITIKGVKEGLVFLLDDSCEFGELLDELHYKLETTHQQLLTGPLVHVQVKLGARRASEEEKERIVSVIRQRGNLLVQSVDGEQDEELAKAAKKDDLKIITGVVRSGQTIRHEGNIMLMGDVNPGGTIMSTGDIYVLGALRGLAHAGVDGRRDVIIASSMLRPTQLRIADIISRPPDEWMTGDAFMEFAYLQEGQMKIDKLSQLHRLRKDPIVFKGV
ncbi:septum site-determining protein MinC [Paenibacillus sambharensis]|uniref:Probable septum site-determining protein MinC n=1 Tax=Paenibacillus sambharensis TaxID=1803190 RepID=A0A2W1L7I9_9BACL|nr:septum site-determining protein MinC [Paenibacillus sambharensis]PZD94120.1 septum site-determining protein MinC [Paenibacillus sambharensis]